MTPSDRAQIERRLAEAERHVAGDKEQVRRFARSGLLTSRPLALLMTFKDSQAAEVAVIDRLGDELAKSGAS